MYESSEEEQRVESLPSQPKVDPRYLKSKHIPLEQYWSAHHLGIH